jgi:hypothetical protein
MRAPIQKMIGVFAGVAISFISLVAADRPSSKTRKAHPEDRATSIAPNAAGASRAEVAAARAYGSLPLSFEANAGQADPSVNFVAHGSGYAIILTNDGVVLSLQQPDETDQVLDRMSAKVRKRFEAKKFYRFSSRFHHKQKADSLKLQVVNGNGSPQVKALEKLPGKSNYFLGNDPNKWRTGIPTYGRIEYKGVYPGIDLSYYGQKQQLEFDFRIAPGADPSDIRLAADPQHSLRIAKDGSLEIGKPGQEVHLFPPQIYQLEGGRRSMVQGGFVSAGNRTIAVKVSSYDHTKPLIIDPTLAYSTYLGGNGSDYSGGIVVDSQGDAYIVGQTSSTNFPNQNGYQSSGNADGVAFISALNSTGTALIYSTYLGGSGGDWGTSIALGPGGTVYVTGATMSSDFPVLNALQTSLGTPNGNAFIAAISTTQSGISSLLYSSYLGGGGNATTSAGDEGLAIAADSSGLAYVTGQTASDGSTAPFPTTSNAYQSTLGSPNGNAFLAVIDPSQSGANSLIYSTYLGGESTGFGDYGMGITVDNSGDAYLTGETTSGGSAPFPITASAYQSTLNSPNGNVFVAEIATTQSGSQGLVYSTYLGGSSDIIIGDSGSAVALDPSGLLYIGGDTTSSDFPTTPGAFQTTNSAGGKAFAAKMDLTKIGAQSLLYSTFLGGTNGSEGEVANGIAVDTNGDVYVVGSTSSSDFPTTSNGYQTTQNNGAWAAYLTELNATASGLNYSTFLAGSCSNLGDLGYGVALDTNGNPYVSGSTCSTNFPVAPSNAYQTSLAGTYNAFIAKFALNANPGITASVSPSPNPSGWNNSPVTVSFTCVPGAAPIQSCTSPLNLTTEGANQTISGTAVDMAENSASTSTAVNIDLTPPVVSITSPSNGAIVSTLYVAISGSASDALSGVGGVYCNGAPAAVIESSFACTVPLNSVSNSITVTASDIAGNSSSTTLGVTVSMAAPTSLQVSPGPVTMAVGTVQPFVAIDQTGARRPDASWSVSDSTIATLATDGSGTLTGIAAGEVTLTATVQGVLAQTQVTVLGISSLASGTVLWTAPPISGYTAQQVIQAVPTLNGPDLYSVESDPSANLLLRAFSVSGSQLWQNSNISSSLPNYFNMQAALGDSAGGLLIAGSGNNASNGNIQMSIEDFDSLTGNTNWLYASPYYSQGFSQPIGLPAVGSDGTVFIVEEDQQVGTSPLNSYAYLDAINGKTGALANQPPLPISQTTIICTDNPTISDVGAGFYSSPVVAPDGSVYLLAQSNQYVQTGGCESEVNETYSYSDALVLLHFSSNGSKLSSTTLNMDSATDGSTPESLPFCLIPDGIGGALAVYIKPEIGEIVIADVGGQGTVQASFPNLGNYSVQFAMVLGDNGTAFVTDGYYVEAFSVPSLQELWSYSSGGGTLSFSAATRDGGVAVEDSQLGLIQFDSSGNPSPPVAGFSNSAPWALGFWPMISNGELTFVYGPDVITANDYYPEPQGNGASNSQAHKPTIVHFIPVNTSDLGLAPQSAINEIEQDIGEYSFNEPFLAPKSTTTNFKLEVAKPVSAVGFIGHTLDIPYPPPNSSSLYSIGMDFSDTFLVRKPEPSDNPDYSAYLQYEPYDQETRINTQASIIFVGSCYVGTYFEDLWNINQSTIGEALVVPVNPSATSQLGHSIAAWDNILRDMLVKGMTIGKAVSQTNSYLSSLTDVDGNKITERWQVIGDPSVKLQ